MQNNFFATYKTFIVILMLTIFFLFLSFANIVWAKDKMSSLILENQKLEANNISFLISSWIKDRVLEVEKTASMISYANVLSKDSSISIYLKQIYNISNNFDTVQLFKEDGSIYIGKIGKDNQKGDTEFIKSTKWYNDTKNTLSTTISIVQNHLHLHTQTINICSPVLKNYELNAIFCGILQTNLIFNKIKNLPNDENIKYFLIDKNNKIITKTNDEKFFVALENFIKKQNFNKSFNYNGKKYKIILSKIEGIEQSVGILSDKSEILAQNTNLLLKKTILNFAMFLLLIFVANFLHQLRENKIKNQKKEYEIMLNQNHKMAESGELIASISHQIKQPLNSISLMISSLFQLNNNNKLDKNNLIEILNLGQKSIDIIDGTITTFRNFYSQNEKLEKLNMLEVVEKILHIIYVDFSKSNIIVIKNIDKNIFVKSYENFILQVLLVLLQNAKEALKQRHCEQKIFIDISFDNDFIYICIKEYGIGLDEKISKNIFKRGTTNKKNGSGLGLYIAKKIAIEKLQGDLYIKNNYNPTIFTLKIKKEINE